MISPRRPASSTPSLLVAALLLALLINTASLEALVYFFSHFQLSTTTFALLKFSFFFLAGALLFLKAAPSQLNSPNFNLVNAALLEGGFVLTPLLMVCLLTATNLFTSVIVLEGLALISLLLYLSPAFNTDMRDVLGGFLLFFWVNAVTSLLFFSLLIVFAYSGHILSFEPTLLESFCTLRGVDIDPSALIFTYITVFFKLALPPFIIWKILIFNKASSGFISYYSSCFFPPILYFLLGITDIVFLKLYGQATPYVELFLGILLISSVLTVSISLFSGTVGTFFAVSGAMTTSLLFVMYVVGGSPVNSSLCLNLLFYLLFYTFSLLFTFSLLIKRGFTVGSQSIASLLYSGGLRSNSKVEAKIAASLLVLALSLFAGLPPFITFYVKLTLLSALVYSFSGAYLLSFFLLFFFALLYFYFKNVRFILVQSSLLDKLRTTRSTYSGIQPYGPSNLNFQSRLGDLLNPFAVLISFFGFFFLGDFLIIWF